MLLLLALAGAASCASEEIPRYGDPQRVGGGAGGDTGTGTTTSTTCQPDTGCAVSFKDDIFPVLDGKGKCATSPGCHGDGLGNLTLTAGDVASYYAGLTALTLKDGNPNIVPCNPDASEMLCNLHVSSGTNPHGTCGTLMPPNSANAPTDQELKDIEDWITCGAPNN